MKKVALKKQQTILSADSDPKVPTDKRSFASKGTSSKVQTQLPLTQKTASVVSPPEKVGVHVSGPVKDCSPEAIPTPTDSVSESFGIPTHETNPPALSSTEATNVVGEKTPVLAVPERKELQPTATDLPEPIIAVPTSGVLAKANDEQHENPVDFQASTMHSLLDWTSIRSGSISSTDHV